VKQMVSTPSICL